MINRITLVACAFGLASLMASSASHAQLNDFYPARAIRDGAQGDTGVKVNFRPDGIPESCEITSSSGRSDLDEAACAMMTHNRRYNVHTDENGKPIYYLRQLVKWRIPGYPDPKLTPTLPPEMQDIELQAKPRTSPSITLPKEPKCRISGC